MSLLERRNDGIRVEFGLPISVHTIELSSPHDVINYNLLLLSVIL